MPESSPAACRFAIRDRTAFCFLLGGLLKIDSALMLTSFAGRDNADDLFFGNGFVHAQDRLWQLELMRRVGSGRLSELFGESTLDADRLMRRIGLRRIAEREAALLGPVARGAYEAYARGVNFCRGSRFLPEQPSYPGAPSAPWRWRPPTNSVRYCRTVPSEKPA